MALPAILAGLGSFAMSPIGQQLMMGGYNRLFGGGNAPNQDQAAQQEMLQQMRQPFQLNTGQRQQQMMNNVNQNIIPGLKEQFAGTGAGLRSSAFGQQLGSAGANLQTNLGALGE